MRFSRFEVFVRKSDTRIIISFRITKDKQIYQSKNCERFHTWSGYYHHFKTVYILLFNTPVK